MKLILLAAAAVIAVPAVAQTTPATPPADQTMPAGDPATTPTDPATPDQTAPAPMGAPTQQAPMNQPMSTTTGDPVGGYQPSAPVLSGGTPGATPVFRPAMSPDQAYPAPAPLASYPVCKRGQYDKCRNPGGK